MTAPRSTALWHPFADMFEVKSSQFCVSAAEGVWIYDQDGRRYLDGTASLWYANAGHGRTEIVEAAAAQMRTLESYFVFNDFTNPPAEELADRLAQLAPVDNAKIFLTTGGGEAIDTAAKLARQYWAQRGQPQRTHIISRGNAYHGTNGMGTSIGGIEANRSGFGDLVPATTRVAHDDAEALREAVERLGADRVAAFFAEPVMGAGGLHPPQPGYLEAVAKLCAEHDILFVADSVICGFGRVGSWFGVERWGLKPDMITFAKGVTSGYLPLGGVVVAERVAEPFWDRPGRVFRHGATYSGHPTVAAAALANLDILEREKLLQRADELERPLHQALLPLADHPAVGEVRGGVGLLGAVELAPEVLAADPGAVGRVQKAVRDLGVIVRPLGKALAVSPPLTIAEAEIELLGKALKEGLDTIG
ncbi:Adenosylmethionine-8-amino-7-oxononanoate aminotransferase [Saccharopolyspora kobensis]|uniref:Adenosylmethionine-8-amino-7-oxononanoate aminotransferase n=3 Tax=Saccharopolyspora kobensis TaxID=146035 RepID=A0A1H5UIY7_9PSEU|nr:Adenosylmethionine-8-amino-7-oxononanoate aminotransferase [Saccharopolyspora kobensis]SFC73429.1 Adenosylmethionine-8-amino-7-oxononanoate aminotransferase [Saccharopolyspora kobensis]